MNEDEIVAQLVSEVDAATASDVSVRTSGGDQTAEPDQVIIDWDSGRVELNGHNSFGGYLTDGNGNNTGIEHHTYFQMEADCQLVFNDELKRDQAIDKIRDAFTPYEYDATQFDEDTAEWAILMASPRSNNQFEPDWYVGGVVLRFWYVTRTDEAAAYDAIEDVQIDVTTDPSSLTDAGEPLIIYSGDTYTVPEGRHERRPKVYVMGTLDIDGILETEKVINNGTIDNSGSLRVINT